MTVGEPQLVVDKLIVIFVNLPYLRLLQQVVAMVHELTERVERAHHLLHVGDDRLILVLRQGGHVVGRNLIVDAELHLLRVDQYELQLIRVLLI